MVVSLETGLVIGSLLASVTFCCVKIIHQIQNSKCKFINCCGIECVRDVEVDLNEAEVNQPVPTPAPRPRITNTQSVAGNQGFQPTRKPDVDQVTTTVGELKKRFGQ